MLHFLFMIDYEISLTLKQENIIFHETSPLKDSSLNPSFILFFYLLVTCLTTQINTGMISHDCV